MPVEPAPQPQSLPQPLPAPREARDEATFFTALEVPRFEPRPDPGPLSLDAAIALAMQESPRLGMMASRAAQAEAGRTVAFAGFLPQANGYYRPMVGDERFIAPTLPTHVGNIAFGTSADRLTIAELNLQWVLWDFGRIAGRYGQAVSQADIARLQFDRARQSVVFNVTLAYFRVLDARAQQVIANEAVRRAESVLRDARNFFQRGVGVRNDVLRAETLLAEMRLNEVKTTTAVGLAVAALNQTIGINVSTPTQVVEPAHVPEFRLDLEQSLRLATDYRDEFGVVLRTIRAAGLGEGVAQADFLPRITTGAVAAHLQPRGAANESIASVGLNLEVPLFDGGRKIGRLQQARAELQEAIAQGKEVCDTIAYEVQTAYLLIADARQRLSLARTAREAADENLRVVRSLSARGDATPTDVVDGELALVRAQQNESTARYDYQTALARLAYAVGLTTAADLAACGGTGH